MKHSRIVDALCVAAVLAVQAGCMPKMTVQELKDHMPQRPPETDRLGDWVGVWQGEGEVKFAMLDESLRVTGTDEIEWGPDQWYVTYKNSGTMEELGAMSCNGTWNYDAKSGKYRSTRTDTHGTTCSGEATYDSATRTWHMTETCFGPHGKMCGKGTAKFLDDNTVEWEWGEYAFLTEVARFTGTSRRQATEAAASE